MLTRHPLAVWSSYVDSFFDGDCAAAHARNPFIERYVPALARFLRERPVPLVHVRYEALVANPEAGLREICTFLGIAYEPAMIEYGRGEEGGPATPRGLGDPITVDRETRPTTDSLAKWPATLRGDPLRLAQCRAIAERLEDPDLALWGAPGPELRRTLAELAPTGGALPRPRLTRYSLERRLLVRLRRNIHRNALGRLVRRVRHGLPSRAARQVSSSSLPHRHFPPLRCLLAKGHLTACVEEQE